MIRIAATEDIPSIETIARQFPKELAFVRRVSIERGISAHELYVAVEDAQVIGFVSWHKRRDGWSTIYDLAVAKSHQGQGIGRMLLYAVPCPIRLKCKKDNPANAFYQNAGMSLVGSEGKLNLYEMRVLNVIICGACPPAPEICRLSGSAYGTQEHQKAYAPIFMLDVEYENPQWDSYLPKVHLYRPVQALVVDYFSPSLKDEMLAQVEDLRNAGVLRIVVATKFNEAVSDIPSDCIVGVSLRTTGNLARTKRNKFAGFMPDFRELSGRRCHLLGGSPQLQKDTIAKLHGVGATVISCDGNSHFGAGRYGSTYLDSRWKRKSTEGADWHLSALISSRNIQRELNAIKFQQLSLFG